jgi:flagellar protein FlaJ
VALVGGLAMGVALLYFSQAIILPVLLFLFPFVTTFVLFCTYPALKKSSLGKTIGEELPFVVIYMAAVSSSDLEPTKMFRLVSGSQEYPAVGSEMQKVLNQIDLYGYNLATALQNVAKTTVHEKISDLFSGIAINVTSGGSLKNYLEKKAENFLLDYRLERQRYTALAETFMDIYISLLITAPLLLMILFIVMSMTGFNIGMSVIALNFLVISLVSLMNIFFLVLLQIKQPKS